MRHDVALCLSLTVCWLTHGSGVEGSETLETERAGAFGAEVRDVLVNKILKKFTALDALEKKYAQLNLQSIALNSTQMVEEKVAALQMIFRSREEMVKRIATEAEKLHEAEAPGPITNEMLTFYKQEDPDSSTNETAGIEPIADDMGKLYYRNAKCGCGYQLPIDIPDSACFRSQEEYRVSSQFGNLAVSYNMSSVHIPTEIYNQDPDVLKDIYLSQGMSEILKKEVCKTDSFSHLTRWTYYTTHRGVMRFFPDRIWADDCDRPDIYDSRVSPWYVQSVSSPKDVTILIDNSGSVEGLTLNLFFRSVRHLLDTLGVNDFVNIVLFNEEAKYINENCTGLLQATPRNKQILQEWMENIKTENRSFFEDGFDLALKTLNSTSQPESLHANCNPMIMLFTDGGATYPTKALDKWNPNGDKRVFAFAVGKNFYEKETTKDIACRNRGNFNSIPSYTATKSEVQAYLVKISEPLVSQIPQSIQWTLPYHDQLDLGLVVSASMPVYETKEDGTVRSLGIVGTDLVLEDLKKTVMDPEMGPDYYPFAVDNNGFAMFHPNIKETSHGDIITVDLMDLEHPEIAEIRRDIIDGSKSSQTLDKKVTFDGRYSATSQYTYSYSAIDGTVLKFGLGIHSSKLKYYDTLSSLEDRFPDLTIKRLVEGQKSNTVALLYSTPCKEKEQDSYNPCEPEKNNSLVHLVYEDGATLGQFADATCEQSAQLYSSLLLHARMSDDIATSDWDTNSTIDIGDGVLALYTALETPSFVRIKFFNSSEQTSNGLSDDDEEIQAEITKILANPRKQTYLRRAIHEPEWTIYSYVKAPTLQEDIETVDTPSSTALYDTTTRIISTTQASSRATTSGPYFGSRSIGRGYIVSSKVVKTSTDQPSISPVVTGSVFDPETFQKNVLNLAYKCSGNSSCSVEETELACADAEKTSCLIMDDGGFLILSNQEQHSGKMGKFFGLIDGELMRRLVEHKVYREVYVYDYQAICEKSTTENSAGVRAFTVPTIADVISVGWWFSSAARLFLSSFFHAILLTLWSLFDVCSSHISMITGFDTPTQPEHCILKSTIYEFGANSQLYVTFKIDTCERSFTAVQLSGTNLLLIVSVKQDCSIITAFSNEPEDVTVEETCPNKTARYRKQPNEQCFDARTMPKSMDSDCSSGSKLLPCLRTLYFFFFLSLSYLYLSETV